MPLIGDIQAAGLTADALAQRITERLKQYFATTPAVSVSVKTINSYSVFVLGEVAKPGKYQLKSYITVLQAISTAGGFTDYAKRKQVAIVRVTENGDRIRREVHIPCGTMISWPDVVNQAASCCTLVIPLWCRSCGDWSLPSRKGAASAGSWRSLCVAIGSIAGMAVGSRAQAETQYTPSVKSCSAI